MSETQAALAQAGSGEPILEVSALSAYYGNAQALEDVSFVMQQDR